MTSMTLKPMHPGEVLREEFMKPLGLSAYRVATAIDVPSAHHTRSGGIFGGIRGFGRRNRFI